MVLSWRVITMKLWQRIMKQKLQHEIDVSENQLVFMPKLSTTDVITFLQGWLRGLDRRKDIYIVFIDLE